MKQLLARIKRWLKNRAPVRRAVRPLPPQEDPLWLQRPALERQIWEELWMRNTFMK